MDDAETIRQSICLEIERDDLMPYFDLVRLNLIVIQ